jgi:hypothetical protein
VCVGERNRSQDFREYISFEQPEHEKVGFAMSPV